MELVGLGAINEEIIKKTLSIPQNYKVVAITPIGEIAESKDHYDKKEVKRFCIFKHLG